MSSIADRTPEDRNLTLSPSSGGISSNRPSFSALASSWITGPGASHIRPSADANRN